MTADVPHGTAASRASDRPGDVSPFALGLLLRRAHWRAAAVMTEALRPLGIELRHFAVLIVLVDRGPTVQRDLAAATGSDKAGIMRVVDDLERKGLAVRKTVPGDRRGGGGGGPPPGGGAFCPGPGGCGQWRSRRRASSFSTRPMWRRSGWPSVWSPTWGPASPSG